MKTRLLALLFLFGPCSLFAQQLPVWSQFRAFNYVYNPAYFEHFDIEGEGSTLDLDLAYRHSYTSFDGAPRTAMLGAQFVQPDWRMSLGGAFSHDRFGPTSYSRFQLFYAYRIPFSRRMDHGLSIGLSGSVSLFQVDGTKIKAENPTDGLLQANVQNSFAPNVGMGLYYYIDLARYGNAKYFIAGLALDQGLPTNLNFTGQALESNLKREIHVNGQLGFRVYFGRSNDFAEPMVLFRYAANAPLYTLGGFRLGLLDQRLQLGAYLSSAFECHFQIGFEIIPNLYFGYAPSIFLQESFNTASSPGSSHELTLGYHFDFY